MNGGGKESATFDQIHNYDTFEPSLDGMITKDEVGDALKGMKGKKSPGPDGVLTEYLKIFGDIAEHILLKLISLMFSHHLYPTVWRLNFLKPIYKKDDSQDPNNYRGLAIGSALAKLYSLILLKRLKNYVHINKYISPNQIGFMEGFRTSDHIFLLQTVVEKVIKKNRKRLFCVFVDFKKAYDTVDRNLLLRKLQNLGINGVFYKNIAAMYMNTEYSIKLDKGTLDPIKSNLGLKQGCPLSPILFNIYIDDIKNIFDHTCDPIDLQGKQINYFLYADDLVLLSTSKDGLQNCLDRLQNFSKANNLTINIAKTKSMVFNNTGRLIKQPFYVDNKKLEQVQTFCYLGFDVKASGVVSSAINTLYDKANKAMRPLMGVISRFNIPIKTSLNLFHAYVAPIVLYATENWMALSNKKLQNFAHDTLFTDIGNKKADVLHRQFLKYIMGTSKSSPNMAIYGEVGELPLSLKAYRLMLNYWYRLTFLPDDTLVKTALLENIQLRTNWIRTIEKLVNFLDLSDLPENLENFKTKIDLNIKNKFINFWKKTKDDKNVSRLHFYSQIKQDFSFEAYLDLSDFTLRKTIAKFRCSDHTLEIEKGRHSKTPRDDRLCKLCNSNEIETEDHFLTKCQFYVNLKTKHLPVHTNDSFKLLCEIEPETLGKYLLDAFSERKKAYEAAF